MRVAVRRKEDPRLLKGNHRYVDDVHIPDEVRGDSLRSPHRLPRRKPWSNYYIFDQREP